jgi:DNA excision repair protein ERCC-1
MTRIAIVNEWILVCAFSTDEAAQYLETYKLYENKSADTIKERVDEKDPKAQLANCLLKIKGVNKTDVATLASTFGSMRGIISASMAELAMCPGIGPVKVRRIFDAFHAPFLPGAAKKNFTGTIAPMSSSTSSVATATTAAAAATTTAAAAAASTTLSSAEISAVLLDSSGDDQDLDSDYDDSASS